MLIGQNDSGNSTVTNLNLIKEILKVSKVSSLTLSKDKGGRFTGEIQLQGGGIEVDKGFQLSEY